MNDAMATKQDIVDIKQNIQLIMDAFVGVNAKIDRLDQKIDDVEDRLNHKIDDVEERLSQKIDEVDNRLGQKIDEVDRRLDQKINDLAAAVGDAMDRNQAFMDELWGNHERRLCRLEKRAT